MYVMSRIFILKVNKKGRYIWDQFCLIWDPAKNEEVYVIICILKLEVQHVDHKLVTFKLLCGLVSQVGQQV